MINMIHYQNPSQKVLYQSAVLSFCLNQRICCSDHAFFSQHFSLRNTASSAHIRQRKKGSPAKAVFLQKSNHPFSCLFIICDNVLNASSKSSLNGDLVIFLYMDDVCHYSVDSRFSAFLFHYAANTVSVSVIPLCKIF